MEIDLELRWRTLIDGEAVEIDELLFALLHGIAEEGQLNFAAKAEGVSYRHAWGLIRAWEARLGAPLLVSVQGRGASLTGFASGLLQARAETNHAIRPSLSDSALHAGAVIDGAIEKDRRRVRIASSHNDRVLCLREKLVAERRDVTLEIVGSESALRQYRRGDADVAGFHLPLGTLGSTVGAKLIASLDDKHDQIFLIEQRILGLMSRNEKPCSAFEELISGDLQFVNRQAGSATRLIFDGLLGAGAFPPVEIKGYHDEEYTHTAVGALVASRNADVAFGSQSAAEHFDLHFKAMVEERFYIVINREFDNAVRQFVTEFCARLEFADVERMSQDEFVPTVAVMKHVHDVGPWRQA